MISQRDSTRLIGISPESRRGKGFLRFLLPLGVTACAIDIGKKEREELESSIRPPNNALSSTSSSFFSVRRGADESWAVEAMAGGKSGERGRRRFFFLLSAAGFFDNRCF